MNMYCMAVLVAKGGVLIALGYLLAWLMEC